MVQVFTADDILAIFDELGTEGLIALDPEKLPYMMRGYHARLETAWRDFMEMLMEEGRNERGN